MKHLVLLILTLSLLGCAGPSEERTEVWDLPEGLKDCKVFKLTPRNALSSITVVRCPQSVTTTHTGGKGAWTASVQG